VLKLRLGRNRSSNNHLLHLNAHLPPVSPNRPVPTASNWRHPRLQQRPRLLAQCPSAGATSTLLQPLQERQNQSKLATMTMKCFTPVSNLPSPKPNPSHLLALQASNQLLPLLFHPLPSSNSNNEVASLCHCQTAAANHLQRPLPEMCVFLLINLTSIFLNPFLLFLS